MSKLNDIWSFMHCPQCSEPITEPKQVRCKNCKVLFDWEDEE